MKIAIIGMVLKRLAESTISQTTECISSIPIFIHLLFRAVLTKWRILFLIFLLFDLYLFNSLGYFCLCLSHYISLPSSLSRFMVSLWYCSKHTHWTHYDPLNNFQWPYYFPTDVKISESFFVSNYFFIILVLKFYFKLSQVCNNFTNNQIITLSNNS